MRNIFSVLYDFSVRSRDKDQGVCYLRAISRATTNLSIKLLSPSPILHCLLKSKPAATLLCRYVFYAINHTFVVKIYSKMYTVKVKNYDLPPFLAITYG